MTETNVLSNCDLVGIREKVMQIETVKDLGNRARNVIEADPPLLAGCCDLVAEELRNG